MKKKLVYIISDVNKSVGFEWTAAHLKQTQDLSFILLNNQKSSFETFLEQQQIPFKRVSLSGKKDWIKACYHIYKHLKKNTPDIVHCHLQQATRLGLIAAKLAGIKHRIHTRHHASYHHVYFPKGVWWDKLCNRLSTKIVAISGLVKEVLTDWEKVPEAKLVVIPHGFLLPAFSEKNQSKIDSLREKYNPQHGVPVIGVISRFTELKGIQYIIPAFQKLLQKYPGALLLLFNARGDYEKEINQMLSSIPTGNFKTIPFEEDIMTAYHLMDVFVHVPVEHHSEAFGQTYIEALAAGVPLVATKSGIANDILLHRHNAWIAAYKDSDSIHEGIVRILEDGILRQTLIRNGKETAAAFSLDNMIDALNNLYETI